MALYLKLRLTARLSIEILTKTADFKIIFLILNYTIEKCKDEQKNSKILLWASYDQKNPVLLKISRREESHVLFPLYMVLSLLFIFSMWAYLQY